jgi:endonuclease/exonuclease/phosphatase family metal-dependent hydrolase
MNILTYNLRSGGKRKGETSWGEILEEFSPDLVFAQETYDPSSYRSPEKQFHPDDSIIWQPTSVGWGSAIFVRKEKLLPINVPNFEGWVVGGKIEGFPQGLASDKPLYVSSVHTPSPGPYDKKALSILDAIKEISGDNDLIIAGDFNTTTAIRHPSEELKNSKLSIEFITRMREELGLINSWQVINPNKNLPQTLRWSRNQAAPYHCDGIFIPLSWVRYIEQCTIHNSDYWKKMSDHNPIHLKIKS